jgi:hypothetical protein
MKLSATSAGIEAELEPRETLLFSNILNEVCNGFALQDFERAIGAPHHEVCALFDRFRKLRTARNARISVTDQELRILQNALRETLRELGVEEFSTRTGLDFDVGEGALRELQGLTGHPG